MRRASSSPTVNVLVSLFCKKKKKIEALELYRLAPLPCRRDMAMLGVLHKISLGLAPSQLDALFSSGGNYMGALLGE